MKAVYTLLSEKTFDENTLLLSRADRSLVEVQIVIPHITSISPPASIYNLQDHTGKEYHRVIVHIHMHHNQYIAFKLSGTDLNNLNKRIYAEIDKLTKAIEDYYASRPTAS